MSELHDRELIYDWNLADDDGHRPGAVGIIDETLYEGLHAPHAVRPDLEWRATLLRRMQELHLRGVNLGPLTPATAPEIAHLVGVITSEKLRLVPSCVVEPDAAIIEFAAEAVGPTTQLAVVVHASAIQQQACGLSLAEVAAALEGALLAAARHSLDVRVMFHDATRARPAGLRRLIGTCLEHGVTRMCLWDSAGYASPDGTQRLVEFVRGIADDRGMHAHLGWFGRNDRDLAVINALHALYHGADTLHGTALGLGHGAGNTPIDLLLVNLLLLELIDRDLSSLKEYCESAAKALGVAIPVNYPVFGGDAFRTATGVHAAAIIKARAKGDHWLADRVYSGVPAGLFGLHQVIDVGPMSGESNVVAWLESHQIEPVRDLVKAIMTRAKASTHTLTADEMHEEIRAFTASARG